MHRVPAILLLGLLLTSPSWAESSPSCSPDVRIPVNFTVLQPICPNEPLTLLAGACGPCVDLVTWTEPPRDLPIMILAVMDPARCILTVCQPDSLRISIGRYAAGSHLLVVEVRGTVADTDSTFCFVVQRDTVRFDVPITCAQPPSPACFLYEWRHDPADPACDTRVGPGTPGRLVFEMTPFEPLVGLHGRFVLDPPELRITRIRPIGLARGMHLLWQPLEDGASFVLSADAGVPLRAPAPCATCAPPSVPVLEITVAPRPGLPIPSLTRLAPAELVGVDSLGREMLPCPTFAAIPPATICAGPGCDFNGDGRADLRDLVRMVRCLLDSSTCPASVAARFDCNGDSVFTWEDVRCCARVILHHPMPDSTVTRPAPGLCVEIGALAAATAGLDVPVHVGSAGLVGAGRLAFAYPLGVFEGADVELLGETDGWLQVSEAADGELIVGLIAVAEEQALPGDLDLLVHLGLVDGQEALPDISLTGSEFAGPDAVPLAAGPPPTTVPPRGPAGLELSEAQPNPFTRETQFVLSLALAEDTDLGVFDLSGRRVATLHRGVLAAGSHLFRWDGSRDDGARARDGVYFYRAQGTSASATRKLVLLRGE